MLAQSAKPPRTNESLTAPGRNPGESESRTVGITSEFWFVMSMALLAGFIVAYPINWWLVAKGLKHGMMTVRGPDAAPIASTPAHATHEPTVALPNEGHAGHATASRSEIVWMAVLSVAVFALGIGAVAVLHGNT